MNRKSEVFVFGKIKLAPSQIEYIKPEKANARNPCNPNTKTLRLAGAARLARSRPANPNIPKIANIERNEKLSVVGFKITITPNKPNKIANQRRHPTFSPKTSVG